VVRFVMRTRQYVAALFPHKHVLALCILRYAHELRKPENLGLNSEKQTFAKAELDLAKKLVLSWEGKWDSQGYKDESREKLLAIARSKRQQIHVTASEVLKKGQRKVSALTTQLRNSLALSKTRRSRVPKKPSRRTKRQPTI
jgi:non-homologous end joining protein Ku